MTVRSSGRLLVARPVRSVFGSGALAAPGPFGHAASGRLGTVGLSITYWEEQ